MNFQRHVDSHCGVILQKNEKNIFIILWFIVASENFNHLKQYQAFSQRQTNNDQNFQPFYYLSYLETQEDSWRHFKLGKTFNNYNNIEWLWTLRNKISSNFPVGIYLLKKLDVIKYVTFIFVIGEFTENKITIYIEIFFYNQFC